MKATPGSRAGALPGAWARNARLGSGARTGGRVRDRMRAGGGKEACIPPTPAAPHATCNAAAVHPSAVLRGNVGRPLHAAAHRRVGGGRDVSRSGAARERARCRAGQHMQAVPAVHSSSARHALLSLPPAGTPLTWAAGTSSTRAQSAAPAACRRPPALHGCAAAPSIGSSCASAPA